MPHGVVKTTRDEHLWSKAKAAAHKQYPDIDEDNKRFWKIVMGIYKTMKGGKG